MPKYQQFAGSPDIFETETGRHIKEDEAKTAGLFTPEGLSADVQRVESPRPGVKTEADFATLAGTSLVASSTPFRKDGVKTGTEIDDFASKLGIEPPQNNISDISKEIIAGIKSRQTDLAKREQEDIANIEKSFATGSEELKLAQEEETKRREGRTRIGGFLVKSEVDDLETMYRQHRVETANLLNQKQTLISQAQRAWADGDFKLSQELLSNAKDIEKEEQKKKQDYFDNVIKAQALHERLQKPIKDAEKADIDQAIDWMEKAPSAFKDIKPSDIALGKISFGEIQARYLDSNEYAKSLEKEAPASVEEYNYLLKNGQIPKGTSYIDYEKMKATQFGTEGEDGVIPSNKDTVVKNLLSVGLKPEIMDSKFKLTKSNTDKILAEGVPTGVINFIWSSIKAGKTLDTIRAELTKLQEEAGSPNPQEAAFGSLDAFMGSIQNDGEFDFDNL